MFFKVGRGVSYWVGWMLLQGQEGIFPFQTLNIFNFIDKIIEILR